MKAKVKAVLGSSAGVAAQNKIDLGLKVGSRYTVTCTRKGKVKWREVVDNLVVTLGRNLLLDNSFQAAAASVSWFVFLKNAGSIAAGDTMASHAGWTENTTYSNATRPAYTNNGVASGGATSNSAAKAVFNINGTTTVSGAGLSSNSTKGGTSGTLYGAADFASPRSVISGDTLTVEVDLTITS